MFRWLIDLFRAPKPRWCRNKNGVWYRMTDQGRVEVDTSDIIFRQMAKAEEKEKAE